MKHNVSYKLVDAKGLAEMLFSIQNSDNELSFATCYETGADGNVLEQSTGDWWGAKFAGAFDGTYLIIGAWGGRDWWVFDATRDLTADEIESMMVELFRRISAQMVCITPCSIPAL